MTLRQQLLEIMLQPNISIEPAGIVTTPEWEASANEVRYEKKLDQLEAICQEIAREARLDEMQKCVEVAAESFSYGRAMGESLDDGRMEYGIAEKYFIDRIVELTQKPPQPNQEEKHE
jgi:S-methylmethionine-dependent homocysteine/selenocysteine methylase